MRFAISQTNFAAGAFGFLLATASMAAAHQHRTPPPEPARVLWRFEIPSNVSGQHVGVGADGRVYTTSFDPPHLYAITPQGTLVWSLAIGEGSYWPITFAGDGTIYTGSARGIRAVNPDGTLRWGFDPGNWPNAGPSVGPDGNIYAANDGLGFFSLDPLGNLRWSNPGNPAASGLYFDADEIVFGPDRLFGGVHFTRSGPWISTYAFDLDGNQAWFRQIVGLQGGPSSNPRLLLDGRVIVRWDAGSLAALHPSGIDDWVEPHPDGAQHLVSPAVGPDGAVYAGDQYGVQLWAANPDGSTGWVLASRADENLGAVGLGVSPDNGVLIAGGWTSQTDGTNAGWVRGFDPADGDLLWQLDLEPEQGLVQLHRTVRPAYSPDGSTAYVTTWFAGNGVGHSYLYAIALREPPTGVPDGGHRDLERPRLSFSSNPCIGPAEILLETRGRRRASIVIYDVAGRQVRRLFAGPVTGRTLQLEWDLLDERKRAVEPGVYFLDARTPDGNATGRIVVAR